MKDTDILKVVREAIRSSELIRSILAVKQVPNGAQRSATGGATALPLSEAVIAELEKNGNVAEDWKKVKAVDGFNPSRVRNSFFYGDIVLGRFDGKVKVAEGAELPTGIYNSTLTDCCVASNVLVCDVKLLSNYVVKEGAVLFNNGLVCTERGATFGNGAELPIAIETGGREVRIYGEITVDVAGKIATSRADKKLLREYNEAVDSYVDAVTSEKGLIERGAVIKNTRKVLNTYVGSYALIDNATAVVNTSILSNKEERAEISEGAYVSDSVIQWGSEVTSMAIVDTSALTEHSHVERHGKVTQSILGPNTGVAEGEVTASLLGPFVGFHHQALLIAALWPEGKGNVAYGANIGSNHTSKAPDQELWPGEGVFFGLGVNIKYPSDFTRAPYSIFAMGVNALAQKLTFPFSLINTPAAVYKGVSPAYNEIRPAWLLTDNMYTLRRNEEKFKKRNKAKRTTFDFDVFRPHIVDLMIDARNRLLEVTEVKDLYTDKDIRGLGKNYMLEESRLKAIEAYTFYIKYYALLGLKRKVEELLDSGSKEQIADLISRPSSDLRWEHQRRILETELRGNDVAEGLRLLAEMQEKVARDVEKSKEKDDRRGCRIIDDYEVVHPSASNDAFVLDTWRQTRKMQNQIEELLSKL